MHRARARVLQPSESEEPGETVAEKMAEESAANVTSSPPALKRLHTTSVSVLQPSRNRANSDGVLKPFSLSRSRSSSSRSSLSNSLNSLLWGKDVWVKAELFLTERMLCYAYQDLRVELLLEDMIGIEVKSSPPENNAQACTFVIHAYPIISKKSAKNQIRRLWSTEVQFDDKEAFEENFALAREWKTKILAQTQKVVKETFEHATSETGGSDEEACAPRNFLVFINPIAGKQKGVSEFKQFVKPMFDLAEIEYKLIITKRQNNAREMIKDYDLSKVDAIIISSGDGLLHEVVNGLMERKDWRVAIKVPIGMLPTGSGNALVASTLYESGEEFSLETAAFQIIRGGLTSLDLATVQFGNGTSLYMTILAGWGMIADIDIESERFRRIGEARFTLGALVGIAKKRVYRGRLSYLVCEGSSKEPEKVQYEVPPPLSPDLNNTSSSLGASDEDASLRSADVPNGTAGGDGVDSSPSLSREDSLVNALVAEAAVEVAADENTSTQEGQPGEQPIPSDHPVPGEPSIPGEHPVPGEQLIPGEHPVPVDRPIPSDHPASTDQPITTGDHCNSDEHPVPVDHPIPTECPVLDLLVPLDQSVPDSWVTMEADFLSFSNLMIPLISRTFFGDPNLKIGSGKLRLVWIDGAITRGRVLRLMNTMETGTHLQMEEMSRIDVKAFRLEPLSPPGIMTVDGERMPYGPMQCQIHPNMACTFSRRRKT